MKNKNKKMKDFIDERDKKEKMANSVVKRRNIVYQPIQDTIKPQDKKKKDMPDQAAEILRYLRENSQANKVLQNMDDETKTLSPEEVNELLKDR